MSIPWTYKKESMLFNQIFNIFSLLLFSVCQNFFLQFDVILRAAPNKYIIAVA